MDIDLALSADCPPYLTDKNTFDEKKDMKRYEKSNNMCMMTFKCVISKNITMEGFLYRY